MSADTGDWRAVLLDIWHEGRRRSMVGDDPAAHLRHADRIAASLVAPGRALDLGSGAGIPGLALAGTWPASEWVLVDAAQRRVRFLLDAVDRLGWADRVTVVHGRAELLARDDTLRATFDLVVARSFGPPAVTAECGAPFLRLDGVLAVTEPPDPATDRWPQEGLASLGLERLAPRQGVQRLRLTRAVDDRVPRRPGIPAKRPLF